jgi:hypothetical protein
MASRIWRKGVGAGSSKLPMSALSSVALSDLARSA